LRKDSFYRICVVEINIPPLQERKDDLPLSIEHILDCYRRKQTQVHGTLPYELPFDQTMLPAELVHALYSYHWPGNIRELQNLLQRYLVTRDLQGGLASLGLNAQGRTLSLPERLPESLTLPEAFRHLEKGMIENALKQTRHHVVNTAEVLGIPP
jgi:transcriptional regulator with PAS, ATPase and Fis domain